VSTGLIIFSRFDSTRLPGKALLPLAGIPLLARVIERALRIASLDQSVDKIVVATSDRQIDDELAAYADSQGVPVFRGDADDVRSRAVRCCDTFGFTSFGRICGDSPLLPLSEWVGAIKLAKSGEFDLVTNTFPRSFPVGMSVEVFAKDALRRSSEYMVDDDAKEHIGRTIYSLPKKFTIKNFSYSGGDTSQHRAAVDTEADFLRIERFFELYEHKVPGMTTSDIIQALGKL